jgi:hypothetical protein
MNIRKIINIVWVFMSFIKINIISNALKPKIPGKIVTINNKIKQKTENIIQSQYIRTINNQHTFNENDVELFLNENEFIKNKKLISISPGGLKGFYMLGICKYLKQNYNLDNYIFSGASAGAWNSLMLCFNRDISEIEDVLFDSDLQKTKSISELEYLMKYKILSKYTTEDFDLRRLFIGVTTVSSYKTNTTIFSGFDNLDDAINCCVASSHIPLITGGLINYYRNILSFDGGFSKYPYLNITNSVLHITPNIWRKKQNQENVPLTISDYTTLFSKDKFDFKDLIKEGYQDTLHNRDFLDKKLL